MCSNLSGAYSLNNFWRDNADVVTLRKLHTITDDVSKTIDSTCTMFDPDSKVLAILLASDTMYTSCAVVTSCTQCQNRQGKVRNPERTDWTASIHEGYWYWLAVFGILVCLIYHDGLAYGLLQKLSSWGASNICVSVVLRGSGKPHPEGSGQICSGWQTDIASSVLSETLLSL